MGASNWAGLLQGLAHTIRSARNPSIKTTLTHALLVVPATRVSGFPSDVLNPDATNIISSENHEQNKRLSRVWLLDAELHNSFVLEKLCTGAKR